MGSYISAEALELWESLPAACTFNRDDVFINCDLGDGNMYVCMELPFPFHNYMLTHTGLVFGHRNHRYYQLVLMSHCPLGVSTVKLKDIFGRFSTLPVDLLIAHTFYKGRPVVKVAFNRYDVWAFERRKYE